MVKKIKTIDFSRGIKSTEIDENFNILTDIIAEDRLRVSGYGYLSGLKVIVETNVNKPNYYISDKGFRTIIEEGRVINKKGEEIQIDRRLLEFGKLDTVPEVDQLEINNDGIILLPEYPYKKNDMELVNKTDSYNNLVDDIKINNGTINIKSVKGREVTVLGVTRGKVSVEYHIAQPRYDVVVLKDNNTIEILRGTESTSRSFYESQTEDLKIAIVGIIPHDYKNNKTKAYLEIEEMKDYGYRNIYTDDKNELYIGGSKFKNMQIISIEEPIDPSEYSFWYDVSENILKVWRYIEGIGQWVNIKENSFMDVSRVKLWKPEEFPKDGKTFLLNNERDPDMHFAAGKNAISIKINNDILMQDEYYEITDDERNEKYYNTGIGFELKDPIVLGMNGEAPFVEMVVTHKVKYDTVPTRFERTAIFVDTGVIEQHISGMPIKTDAKYLKDENQLEVFLNGKKLIKNIDYKENAEGKEKEKNAAIMCDSFSMLKATNNTDIIEYKVTTNIFSYDYISLLLKELLDYLGDSMDDSLNIRDSIKKIESDIESNKQEQSSINNNISHSVLEISNELQTTIKSSNLNDLLRGKIFIPISFYKTLHTADINIIKELNYSIELTNISNILNSFSNRDYMNIIIKDFDDKERTMMMNEDFTIFEDTNIIKFISIDKIDTAKSIYISGTKFEITEVI